MDQDDKLIEIKLTEFLKNAYPDANIYSVRKSLKGNYFLSATWDYSYDAHSEDVALKPEIALQICKLIKLKID